MVLLIVLIAVLAVSCAVMLVLIWRNRRGRQQSGAVREPWPRSEKLTLTGTVVTATTSLIVLVVTTLHDSGASAIPTPSPSVTPIDLRVAAVTLTDPTEKHPDPIMDIRLRNVGSQVSELTAVTMTVRTFGVVTLCEAGGFSSPTATYSVVMPIPASPGTVVTAPITQDLPPNTADNFQLDLSLPGPVPESVNRAPGQVVYIVDLAITHDGSAPPVPAGQAAILLPADAVQAGITDFGNYLAGPYEQGLDPNSEIGKCYEGNRSLLKQAQAAKGARSAVLAASNLNQ